MGMTLLDSVAIDHPGSIARTFNLYSGDVCEMSGYNVDFLVVSALPGDYTPTSGSVIGELAAKGISVQAMSANKAANYEPTMPCWISNPVVNPQPGIAFSRILVYEPASPATNSVNLVGDIFRALAAFQGDNTTSVALPLVSTGSGGADPSLIMRALFFAAVSWGSRANFTLPTINLVLYQGNPTLVAQMQTLFASLKSAYLNVYSQPPSSYADQARGVANKFNPLPPNLSYRQIWGIALYTSNYYGSINSVLRTSNITQPAYQAMMPIFECIDSGLANVPNWTGQANRGSGYYDGAYNEYQVGNTILHLAYMSYSYGPGWGGAMQFHTQSLTGNKIDTYSIYQGEREILFDRGMKDQVTQAQWNASHNGGVFYTNQVVAPWSAK
jgi:hypothetical protein